MAHDSAHQRGWQTFEVVFGIPLLIAIALQWLLPFSLPRGGWALVFTLLGATLIVLGLALIVLARREFRKYGQGTDPGHPTHQVISTGVFSISRNPLYLGGISLLAGLALTFNLPWVLVLLLPAIIACHYILIAPEERYLAVKFGDKYRLYTQQTARWLGFKR